MSVQIQGARGPEEFTSTRLSFVKDRKELKSRTVSGLRCSDLVGDVPTAISYPPPLGDSTSPANCLYRGRRSLRNNRSIVGDLPTLRFYPGGGSHSRLTGGCLLSGRLPLRNKRWISRPIVRGTLRVETNLLLVAAVAWIKDPYL
jgi:hypothetical protein